MLYSSPSCHSPSLFPPPSYPPPSYRPLPPFSSHPFPLTCLLPPFLHPFPSFPFHPPFPPPPTLPSSIPPSQHMPSDSSRRLTKQYLDIHEDSLGLAILFGTVNNSRLEQ